MDRRQFENLVSTMSNVTKKRFGDYGFACGYLVSLVAGLHQHSIDNDTKKIIERQIQDTINMYARD